VRCWRRWADLSPDYEAYQRVAGVYKSQGKEELWLATLKEFLTKPDNELDHARVRVEIAEHFMAKGDYKTAQPYAEQAAEESGAEWAMRCAQRCAEGLGDDKRAAMWARRIRERYGR